jgi:hypothetical protein
LIIPDQDGPRFKYRHAHHGSPRSDRVSPPGRTAVEGPPAALGRGGAAHARAVGQTASQRGRTTTQGLRSWPAPRRQHAPADLHAACPSGRTSAHRLLCRRAILRATGVSLSTKRSSLATTQALHDGGRGPADAAAASAANSKHQTSTWAPTSRTRIRWGETPTAPVRDVWLPAAPSRSTNSPVRRERTQTRHVRDAGRSPRTPDTRRRTRGSGDRTRTPGYRTPDARTPDRRMWTRTGRRTLDGWTLDKRTLTEDADGASKAQWASNILAPRRRWDVEPCCCGRHTRALGNHDGSAVRPPANARGCLLHRKPAAGSLRRQPSGASAHCSRVLDFGWYEGRTTGRRKGEVWQSQVDEAILMGWCSRVVEGKCAGRWR